MCAGPAASGQRASGAAERVSLVPDGRCGCVCLPLWPLGVCCLSSFSRLSSSRVALRARTQRDALLIDEQIGWRIVWRRRGFARDVQWRCGVVLSLCAQAWHKRQARPARTVCDCRPKRRRRQDERRVLHFDGRGCLQLPTPGAHASAMRARTRSGPHTSIRRHAQRLQLGAGCWATTACASLGNAG